MFGTMPPCSTPTLVVVPVAGSVSACRASSLRAMASSALAPAAWLMPAWAATPCTSNSTAIDPLRLVTRLPLTRPGSALKTARAPRTVSMMVWRVAGEPISSSHEKNSLSGAPRPPQRAKASATKTLSTRPDFMSATPGP